jgi:purine-binding chemotaxis protein CheW
MQNQFVVFGIGNESYGVDVESIESIIKMQDITRVPHAPAYISGVTNLRGAVVPVLDLRLRFGMQACKPTADTRIMVVNLNGTHVGMIVDHVSQVVQILPEVIEPPPQMAVTVDSAFIMGVARLDEEIIILLDLKRALLAEEKERLAGG